MTELLDELYFEWLYSQVSSLKRKNPSNTYWNLLRVLYKTEFVYLIANDDNRAADGKDLRFEFIEQRGLELNRIDEDWLHLPCSMLEMFIGLSRRMAFEDDGDPANWFWELMQNIGIDRYNDRMHLPQRRVEAALERINFRVYSRNGAGGPFPLKRPREDQRDVEIWYQGCAYLLEREHERV